LLAQPHLDARWRPRLESFLAKQSQLFSRCFPRFLQRRAARAVAQMRQRGSPFERVRCAITVEVQYNRFYLFAIHRIFSKRFHDSVTSPLSCAEAHLATFPISLAVAHVHGAAANESSQWGSRPSRRLLRNSSLPTRT